MIPMKKDSDRHARMLAILMGKKAQDHMTPKADSPIDVAGEEDADNEEQGGISEEGRSDGSETVCPNCGTHIDTNLAAKDGGNHGIIEGSSDEEASESPEVEKAEMDHEKRGRLFGHPKKGIGIMIGLRK